jgi:ABC-type nitrate/sulfonate/bicarbonate transport system ATPase subunit
LFGLSDIVVNDGGACVRNMLKKQDASGNSGVFDGWHDRCIVPLEIHQRHFVMGATISIDYISHTFKGSEAPTLSDIALTIAPEEKVALIGRSGCGKSTLLHMLAGLLIPGDGCVRVNAHQVTRPSAKWNIMFQKPSLYPWMSVKQNAELGLTLERKKDPQKIAELLELVGLSDKVGENVQSLSGGQQQRVALARSLATTPEVLLLDEPFSALDAFTRASLQDEVTRIVTRQKLTMVIVTHDIEEAAAMADRVLIMSANPGRIVGEVSIDLPYPRDRASRAFNDKRETLMKKFDELVGNGKTAESTGIENSDRSDVQDAA